MDPQKADDTFSLQVLRDLYEGLTSIGPHGEVVPGVASEWTANDAGNSYVFTLRADAKWSDGDRVTAQEFVSGLRRAVDPTTASGSAALLSLITNAAQINQKQKSPQDLGVRAIDDSHVRVDLDRPAPFILQVLAEPIAAPVHLHSGHELIDAKITDGPYVLGSRIVGSHIDLNKNIEYWNSGDVAIPKVRYVNVESEATELREYLADQLELTYTIPEPALKNLKEERPSELQMGPVLGTLYLALDLTEPPFRDSKKVRQALSMAIDRQAITENLTLGATPAFSFVATGTAGFQQQQYDWSTWPRDKQLAVAKRLYADAGYSKAHPLVLTLFLNSGESNQRIMVATAGQWKANLGVETHLLSEEFRVFLDSRKDHKRWDAIRVGWWADYNDASSFLEIFSRDGVQNDPEYRSDEFNRLIDASRTEPSPAKRADLLQSAEKVLLDDYPIIPVYFYAAARLRKPSIDGAIISPLNRTYSKHLRWTRQ